MSVVDEIALDLERQGWSLQINVLNASQLGLIQELFLVDFTPAKVGKGKSHKRDESVRGDLTSWIDPLSPPGPLAPAIELLRELQDAVNRRLYLGIKQFECHLVKYPVGSFYKTHIDRHSAESSRVLSFVFYLNEGWNDSEGGELVVYDRKGNIIIRVLPRPGSMVCFISDEFPHEVLPARKERRSLTGWMNTKLIY